MNDAKNILNDSVYAMYEDKTVFLSVAEKDKYKDSIGKNFKIILEIA